MQSRSYWFPLVWGIIASLVVALPAFGQGAEMKTISAEEDEKITLEDVPPTESDTPSIIQAPAMERVNPGSILRSLPRFGASVFAPSADLQKPADVEEDAEEGVADDEALENRNSEITISSAAKPLTGTPIPQNYVLGAGDTLEINVWSGGREQHALTATVSADGFVFLPVVGRVTVAGQTIQQARNAITQALRKGYTDPQVTLVVAAQRAVDVYVLGDVRRPGRYDLTGMATLFTALYAAGGPSDTGSYRHVRLLRQGEKAVEIDLYDYLLHGEHDGDALLQAGDTVFVTPAQHEIGISGEVRRPARYEVSAGMTLADALEMAGGLTPEGYAATIELWRNSNHRGWQLLNADANSSGASIQLSNGDLIVVKPLLDIADATVSIRGEVQRPDVYALTPNMTAGDLIAAAQGPTDRANLEQALIWRLNNRMSYDLLRFSVTFDERGIPHAPVTLRGYDIVEIVSREPARVEIRGEVMRPASYPFANDMRVSDLLMLAGGPKPGAYTERANLLRLRPDSRYECVPVSIKMALAGDDDADITLRNGDIIEIRSAAEATIQCEVHIDGMVQAPGSYERYENMRVSDLIYAAGGLLPGASAIEHTSGRTSGSSTTTTLKINGTPENFSIEPDLLLCSDDQVSIQGDGEFIVKPAVVTVQGQVAKAGAYALKGGTGAHADTVWTALQRAEGLLPDGNPNGIVLYRGRASLFAQSKDLEQMLNNYNRETRPDEDAELEADVQEAMTAAVSEQLSHAFSDKDKVSVVIPPRKLRIDQSLRAIPIDGQQLLATNGREGDLMLEDGDIIVVPPRRDTVAVVGSVVRPGAVPFRPGLKARDYIEAVGGQAEDAAVNRTVILSPNGSASREKSKGTIEPGDVIVVPSDYIIRSYKTSSGWSEIIRTLANVATLNIFSN